MPQEINGKLYYTSQEVCKIYNCSHGIVLDLREKGVIKDFLKMINKVGDTNKTVFYNKEEVDLYTSHFVEHIYRKKYFTGKIIRTNDTTVLLDDREYKRSPIYYTNYYVSKNGTSIYKDTPEGFMILKITKNGDSVSHTLITTKDSGKSTTVFLHRLVLEAWHSPKPFDKAVVRHLNDIPGDNRLENLKWGTCKENTTDTSKNFMKYKMFYVYCMRHHKEIMEQFTPYHESMETQQQMYDELNDMTAQIYLDKDEYEDYYNSKRYDEHNRFLKSFKLDK